MYFRVIKLFKKHRKELQYGTQWGFLSGACDSTHTEIKKAIDLYYLLEHHLYKYLELFI